MSLRLVFMGTPDFAVPTLTEIVGRGHEVAAVYTRAPKPAGRGMALQPSPVEREARRFGLPVLTPKTLRTAEARSRVSRAQRRRRGGGRLWADPAEADPRGVAARLLQPACLAAAALARRGADQPRHHGGRCRERRHGDEDGRGARHRAGRDGRARADRPGHDRRRAARRARAARRRPDGARARRARARHARRSRRSRRRASPMRPRSTRTRPASTGRSPGGDVHNHIRGLSPFPGAWCEIAATASRSASRSCAPRAARAPARPARVLDDRLTIACGEGAVRILELQRAGRQAMKADEFLRGTPIAPGARLALRRRHAALQAHHRI